MEQKLGYQEFTRNRENVGHPGMVDFSKKYIAILIFILTYTVFENDC